jgi:hypothetical protein
VEVPAQLVVCPLTRLEAVALAAAQDLRIVACLVQAPADKAIKVVAPALVVGLQVVAVVALEA